MDTSTWHHHPLIGQGTSEKNGEAPQSRGSLPISPGPRDRSLSSEDKRTSNESLPSQTAHPLLDSGTQGGRGNRDAWGAPCRWHQQCPVRVSQGERSCQVSHLSCRGFSKDLPLLLQFQVSGT